MMIENDFIRVKSKDLTDCCPICELDDALILESGISYGESYFSLCFLGPKHLYSLFEKIGNISIYLQIFKNQPESCHLPTPPTSVLYSLIIAKKYILKSQLSHHVLETQNLHDLK